MNKLFVLASRKNAAGLKKLAVFFLFCLLFLENAVASEKSEIVPFVMSGKLNCLKLEDGRETVMGVPAVSGRFTQRSVSLAKKENCFLAWDSESQNLLLVDRSFRIKSKVCVSGASACVNQDYILTQTSFFTENRGFEFNLYQIKYSRFREKITVKPLWHGFIDCFISDCFYTEEGICICGGNREDIKHSVYYITKKGIHFCCSIEKHDDFFRMAADIKNNKVYGFLSGRDKSCAEGAVYKFSLDGEKVEKINLTDLQGFPPNFQCFFGYGFFFDENVILPACINQTIYFLNYSPEKNIIVHTSEACSGCVGSIKSTEKWYYYMDRDSLNPNSYYGPAKFNGLSIVTDFN